MYNYFIIYYIYTINSIIYVELKKLHLKCLEYKILKKLQVYLNIATYILFLI